MRGSLTNLAAAAAAKAQRGASLPKPGLHGGYERHDGIPFLLERCLMNKMT